MTDDPCCGQPASRRRRRADLAPLPPNPNVKRGVHLLYLGTGKREVKGSASGLVYVVADHRRHFVVDPADVDALLTSRDFMLRV